MRGRPGLPVLKNHLFPIIRTLVLMLAWPALLLGVAYQWPGFLLQTFTLFELGMVALALAGSATAIGFGQWRLSMAFLLLLLAWCGLRFTDAPVSLTGLAALTLALLPWARERGLVGAAPALTGAIILLCVALLLRGGDTAAGMNALLFDPLDLRLLDLSLAVMLAACGFLALLGRLLLRREAVDSGFAGAIVALLIPLAEPVLSGTSLAAFLAATLSLWTGLLLHAWRMAYIDELTRLPNRRALEERIQRLPREWAVAMLDIDHFKKFNDRWGHDVGDQVLRRVAAVLAGVGGGGQAYRYGGEEFTVIFAHADIERAARAIEALRQEVGRQPFRVRGERDGAERRGRGGGRDMQRITISAGLTLATELTPEAAFDKADKALYRAKAAGRNRLIQA